MQQDLMDFSAYPISYQVGNADVLSRMHKIVVLEPFSDIITSFLNDLSGVLMADKEAKAYSDIITFAFWIRRASLEKLRERFCKGENADFHVGRGVVFHIAPSNVPVNYAYSLAIGLLCGNANIVRIPSKEFPQTEIINRSIKAVLKKHQKLANYIVLIRYGHDKSINDALSYLADVRIVWGGNKTISELRKSELKPRATEITFADRFSLAIIDSDTYMKINDKSKVAQDFYIDTYLTDQNACTSPKAVIWMGDRSEEAKEIFWNELHKVLENKYEIQGIQAVNKLTSSYMLAIDKQGVKKEKSGDNLITRMRIYDISADIMKLADHSGYFFEYHCKNILELKDLCDDTSCQTISYIGEKRMVEPLIKSGIKGVDRIVPIGKSMEFDLLWDGYNLFERLTRIVSIW